MGLASIGDQKLLEVRRNSEVKNYAIQLVGAPETIRRDEQTLVGQSILTGLKVANLSPAVAEELGMPQNALGVVVTATEGTPASRYLAKGDIIRGINNLPIDNVQTLLKALAQNLRGLTLVVERGAQRLYLRLG